MSLRFLLILLLSTVLLSACGGLGQTPPPPAYSVESLGTSLALTENAPPPGYAAVTVPLVDAQLDTLQGYRYTFDLRFNGTFDDTLQPAEGHIRAEVWWDGIAPARRVVLDAGGEAFATDERSLEAVRVVEEYYLVDDVGRCLANVDETARAMAALDVGSLLGGVTEVPYSGTQAVLNGVQAYRYDVSPEVVTLPLLHLRERSRVSLTGELWMSPEYQTAVRYYANVEVGGVQLLDGDRTVSGQLLIRFDVFDLGVVPNVSIPFGC